MLDFGALPPEINSARMYAGPGPGSMLAAAAAWQSLAEELTYGGVRLRLGRLDPGRWAVERVPSATSMAAAAAPYVTWLSATGDQAQQTAAQAAAAASAYESAFAATVPPPTDRSQPKPCWQRSSRRTSSRQNTPAIAATEALYAEMWAQDADGDVRLRRRLVNGSRK